MGSQEEGDMTVGSREEGGMTVGSQKGGMAVTHQGRVHF